MHTPTLISTAFTAAALIAGSAAAPVRRSSIVDDGISFHSAPSSRRSSFVADEMPSSRRGSISADLPSPPSRRASIVDIAASRRRSVANESPLPSRRSSLATSNDIAASRHRSETEDSVPQPARRSSMAVPNDIFASRHRPTVEEPIRRSTSFADLRDITASRSRSYVESSDPFSASARRASMATAADIAATRRRPVTEDKDSTEKNSSVVTPADIAASRRRPSAVENSEQPARRNILTSPQDIARSRRRSFANGDNTPSRRSSLANESRPAWRSSFGSSTVEAEVVVEEDFAPEDDIAPEELKTATAAIPLAKRQKNPLADNDGVVDWKAATAHLDRISIKYEKGIIAHQTNKGTPLLNARLYSPDELAEREKHLRARSEQDVVDPEQEEQRDSISDGDLPTIEADFMAGASEFSVGNPMLVAHKGYISPSTKGGVSLKDYDNDLLWAGPVQIGSNAQPFVLDFDTGSADTWVPSSSCTTNACAKHNKYNASDSSTSDLVEGATLNVQYGDGSTTSGLVYTDDVTVAGLTAKSHTFGAADQMSTSFKNDPQDGIMGLGYQSISQLDTTPFVQNLIKQNKVSAPQFSFSLNSGSGSELYLGGANPSKYSGAFEWHDVVSESYWVVQGNAYVNQESASTSFNAVIDTGTTVVVAPPAQAKAFWANVEGSQPSGDGYYTFPCNNVPEVSFSFGGKQWEMSADNINLGSTYAGSSQCVGSIVGMDIGMSAWIVGDAFLKDVYTTFDFEENRVGFAEKA